MALLLKAWELEREVLDTENGPFVMTTAFEEEVHCAGEPWYWGAGISQSWPTVQPGEVLSPHLSAPPSNRAITHPSEMFFVSINVVSFYLYGYIWKIQKGERKEENSHGRRQIKASVILEILHRWLAVPLPLFLSFYFHSYFLCIFHNTQVSQCCCFLSVSKPKTQTERI